MNSDDCDEQLKLSFDTLNPPIAKFPHIIFENSAKNIFECCAITGDKPALWRAEVIYEADGDCFVRDNYPPEMLRLWESTENQKYLRESYCTDLDLGMVISTRTPPDLVQQLWDYPHNDYLEYLNVALPDWIEHLGWAYVMLEYELAVAMFVTSHANHEWATEMEQRLAARRQRSAKLVPCNERVYWDGPHQREFE